MSLPFIPVVDVSAAERWRALDFRWSQDARSDAGVQQGDKATLCNDKGEITGDMSWKNRRTTGDFGETKMAGKCFCQVWPDLSFQESMFFFFLGGLLFGYAISTPSGDDPRSLFCLGKMGSITNRYGCEFMLHQLHGYGSWWIFHEKTEEVRSSFFLLRLVICLHIVHDYSADYTSG